MPMNKIYDLSAFIIKTFHIVWYEAKEKVKDEGERV